MGCVIASLQCWDSFYDAYKAAIKLHIERMEIACWNILILLERGYISLDVIHPTPNYATQEATKSKIESSGIKPP